MNLKERFDRFENERYPSLEGLFEELVEKGQSPDVMIISCADSRVIPELIFSALPGELFVVRNIANMVPPYDSSFSSVPSAVDYAVEHLKVSKLVVLGHSQCGGIGALLAGGGTGPMGEWLRLGEEVLRRLEGRDFSSSQERQEMAEMINVEVQVERLLSYPSVKGAVSQRGLAVEGWYYRLYPPRLVPVVS